MFIETSCAHDPGSSGAQCFSERDSSRASVSFTWNDEELLGSGAINIASLRDRETGDDQHNVGQQLTRPHESLLL